MPGVASYVLEKVADVFPPTTSVGAYKRTAWPAYQPSPSGAPTGSPDATATVSAAGVLTFTSGLADDTEYAAAADLGGGVWRTVQFETGGALGSAPDFGTFTDTQVPVWDVATASFKAKSQSALSVDAASLAWAGAVVGDRPVWDGSAVARQGRGVYSIADPDFAAVAGEANSSAKVQAAFDAAGAYADANAMAWAFVVVPLGIYNVSGLTLTHPRVVLVGQGGVLRRRANGAVLTIDYTNALATEQAVGGGVSIRDLWIDAAYRNGRTGQAVDLYGCNDFEWRNGGITDGHVASTMFKFNTAGQVRRRIVSGVFRISGTPQTLGIFDTSVDGGALPAADFRFALNECVGSPVDARGCENLYLLGNSCSNILTNASSNKLFAVGNRIATSGADWVIYGTNHLIDGNLANTAPGNIILGAGASTCDIGLNHLLGGTAAFRVLDQSGMSQGSNIIAGRARLRTRIYSGSNQTLTSGVTATLAFNAERYDTANAHDTVTNNSRIVFPEDGAVMIGCNLSFSNASAEGIRLVELQLTPAATPGSPVVLANNEWQAAGRTPTTTATLATGTVGANTGITWTPRIPAPLPNHGTGARGNSLRVQLLNPGAASQPLSVNVDGDDIIVSLATDGGSALISTAAQVIAAVNAHDTASQKITAANTGASTGAGVLAAVALTNLAGGAEITNRTRASLATSTYVKAGDYVELRAYQDSGVNVDVEGGSATTQNSFDFWMQYEA